MKQPFRPEWSRLPDSVWTEIFGNDRPVAIEIGPGLGEFLEVIARREPGWNYYAIERSRTRTLAVQNRIDRAGLINTRVLAAHAECVLSILPDESVDRFYIQFPDPWWKRRHQRRRLMTPELVSMLRRVLRTGAVIEFITDVEEYFGVAQKALQSDPGIEEVPTNPELVTATSFSRKAAKRGWKLHTATYRKLPSG